jgi:dTDP-4-dehydrorhamnose 3,5-epimerase
LILSETPLAGAFLLDIERIEDERGFFARTFCCDELRAHGLESNVAQCSVSFNHARGTLRGLHYQDAPHEEVKIVRCTRGAIWDVIVDLRRESGTYRRWTAVELTADNRRALYIPRGMAHGFITLSDDTEVFYMMANPYVAGAARGLRWDDPAFAIDWPIVPSVMSERDRTYALWEP